MHYDIILTVFVLCYGVLHLFLVSVADYAVKSVKWSDTITVRLHVSSPTLCVLVYDLNGSFCVGLVYCCVY